MFDIGFYEIVLNAIVALLVVGPKEFPTLVRKVGEWAGAIRRTVTAVKREIDKEVNKADEIKRHMERELEIAEAHKNTPPIHRTALTPPAAEDTIKPEIAATAPSTANTAPAAPTSIPSGKQEHGTSQTYTATLYPAAGTAVHDAPHRVAQPAAANPTVRARGVFDPVSIHQRAVCAARASFIAASAGRRDHDRHRGGLAVYHAVQVRLRAGGGLVDAVRAASVLALRRAGALSFGAPHRAAAVVNEQRAVLWRRRLRLLRGVPARVWFSRERRHKTA